MKKILSVVFKSLIFFVGWALLVSFIQIPANDNPAIWRFWAEAIPLLSILVMSFLFIMIEKRAFSLCLITKPVTNCIFGISVGALWLGLSVVVLMLFGVLRFEGSNKVSLIGLWLLSVFLNTVMQELLVRGYLYQMIKHNYNTVAAAIVSTALFTLLHGGAFEAGVIPVLNVLTMSLFMSVALEFTGSLLAPVILHFLWNSVGAIILGGVSLAEDYPHLFNTVFSGSTILSGGIYKIEGSAVVLVLNLVFTLGILFAMKKRKKN